MRLVEFEQWDFSDDINGVISGPTAINPEYVVRVSTWTGDDKMCLEYCDGRTVYSVVVKGTWQEVMAKLRGEQP